MNWHPFAWMKKPTPKTLEQEASDKALQIERDILRRDLQMIEDRHDVQAQREKLKHLAGWLSSRGEDAPSARDIVMRGLAKTS